MLCNEYVVCKNLFSISDGKSEQHAEVVLLRNRWKFFRYSSQVFCFEISESSYGLFPEVQNWVGAKVHKDWKHIHEDNLRYCQERFIYNVCTLPVNGSAIAVNILSAKKLNSALVSFFELFRLSTLHWKAFIMLLTELYACLIK